MPSQTSTNFRKVKKIGGMIEKLAQYFIDIKYTGNTCVCTCVEIVYVDN